MPIKDRRTKIFLLLFLNSSVNFESVLIDEIQLRIFDLSMNQKTKGTLSSMLKEGCIEKIDLQYKITDKGYKELCLTFPFFRYLKQEWDGQWRIISYEIPESKRELRDRLRREMVGWGLGPWHRSFWITPHPIVENLRDLVYGREEEKYVQAFESTHVFGDLNNLVEKVWNKSELETKYKKIFKDWHEMLSTEKTKEEKITFIFRTYISLLREDPGLPDNLLGKKWIGFESYNIFKEVRNILLK